MKKTNMLTNLGFKHMDDPVLVMSVLNLLLLETLSFFCGLPIIGKKLKKRLVTTMADFQKEFSKVEKEIQNKMDKQINDILINKETPSKYSN